MLTTDHLRAEYARHIARQVGQVSLDSALAHVCGLAYGAGLDDALRLNVSRLLHQYRELGKAADRAIQVLHTITPEDHAEVEQIAELIGALETWTTDSMLFTLGKK